MKNAQFNRLLNRFTKFDTRKVLNEQGINESLEWTENNRVIKIGANKKAKMNEDGYYFVIWDNWGYYVNANNEVLNDEDNIDLRNISSWEYELRHVNSWEGDWIEWDQKPVKLVRTYNVKIHDLGESCVGGVYRFLKKQGKIGEYIIKKLDLVRHMRYNYGSFEELIENNNFKKVIYSRVWKMSSEDVEVLNERDAYFDIIDSKIVGVK